jgi:hypothetical protein
MPGNKEPVVVVVGVVVVGECLAARSYWCPKK